MQFLENEWTDDQGNVWTREDFKAKMQWEGGWTGMVCYGGPSVFPPSLREAAQKTYDYEFGDVE